MPRLVACHRCHSLTKIPDVAPGTPTTVARLRWASGEEIVLKDEDGKPKLVPLFDPVLEDFVEKHEHGVEDARLSIASVQVFTVDQRTWDTIDITTKIKTELAAQQGAWYEERDEYREAALKCYNAHGNPDLQDGCPDYLDDTKRIGQASYKDDDGNTINVPPRFRTYLCHLCPYVHSYLQVELRRRRGAYK